VTTYRRGFLKTQLSTNQFGYCKKRSTELATILLADNICKAVDEGNMVGVLYVDLSQKRKNRDYAVRYYQEAIKMRQRPQTSYHTYIHTYIGASDSSIR